MATGGVENRRRTRHGLLWDASQCSLLEAVLTFRALSGMKAAGNPVKGKRSAYRRGTRQDQRGSDRDRATHQPRRIGRGMAPAVELDDGIGRGPRRTNLGGNNLRKDASLFCQPLVEPQIATR